MTPSNIASGWRKTGIHLWNPEVIEQKKRKRQKNLFQILAEDNNGKAAVYSPNKAEEKVQKQLAKEEKERIAEFNRSAKAAKQREQKDAEDLKKRKAQEAREARDAEKQLKDKRKVIHQRQKARQVVFTIPKEPTGQQNHEVEEWVAKSASGRPQRIRNTPKRYDDSVIMIE
ncbi:uncharacterized protein BDZ99DRAFT_480734 [Mytilinidion resinicola]|uniref:Uncharacterized protein n=1 Tax=Mytilinidion resinicola TaxID=574789 RepID=A0A6A6YBY7_9PEZI|nr:uncharacterized protein BDZ99DRAFT_480734 [Mytilinidion resinicola]KAF2805357.1 hypothetical protein BDZ99DRAFT_480734 [Mytilinidion resinicola]